MVKRFFSLFLCIQVIIGMALGNVVFSVSSTSVSINIDPALERSVISPYIYGTNFDLTGSEGWTMRRLGGNRMTGYNWENNASNAGSDWQHYSDNFMTNSQGIPATKENTPGIALTNFHEKSIKMGAAYTLLTLQAAGYVSKDKKGIVSTTEVAPSSRWDKVKFVKGTKFSDLPDLTDNYVYMDECVDFLTKKFGKASSPTGIKGYAIDNEMDLWADTHPRIHPDKTTAAEAVSKSVELSKAIKAVDPFAEIFGYVSYGFNGYLSLQQAPDWNSLKTGYNWFIEYYLDKMKQESDKAGTRLLDVLDLHYYPEAKGGGKRVVFDKFDANNIDCNKARVQAPRTLWDLKTPEVSWVTEPWTLPNQRPIITAVKKSINKYYPGTKLGFTEWTFGGEGHISGGIAAADALGIFGKYGVDYATYWKDGEENNYMSAAFKIYRDYDGMKSSYGNTKVKADTSDVDNSSVYASIEGSNDSKLHMVLINKSFDSSLSSTINIAGIKKYSSAKVWAFDSSSSNITQRAPVTEIKNNSFNYSVPPLTVCHIVLEVVNSNTSTITGYLNPEMSFTDTSAPIIKSGFKAEIVGTSYSSLSDIKGFFTIGNIPASSSGYTLKISKPGFLAREIKNIDGIKDTQIGYQELPIIIWPGDLNQDDAVNMQDVLVVAKCFNTTSEDTGYSSVCDIDKDSVVNMQDVIIIAKYFNKTSSEYLELPNAATPTPTPVPTPTPIPASNRLFIYDDVLITGGSDDSFTDCVAKFDESSTVKNGTKSIAATYGRGWTALSVSMTEDITAGAYKAIKFWVHGGTGQNKSLSFYTYASDNTESKRFQFTANPGVWTEITVPLPSIGNPSKINRVCFQDWSGNPIQTIYFDDIRFEP